MDKTETYVKMADCEEVQGQHKFDEELKDFITFRVFPIKGEKDYKRARKVWLPRQDQIQEMMLGIGSIHQFFVKFFYWYSSETRMMSHLITAEQLWLAFYMLDKHGKIWDGEKWLKSE